MVASVDDLMTASKLRNQTLGQIVESLTSGNTDLTDDLDANTLLLTAAISSASGNVAAAIAANTAAITAALLPIVGSFTLGAAATLVVTQAATAANSIIVIQPTNAGAGTLQGSAKCLYISAKSAGVSFTVATASGVAATGGETFNYIMVNP